MKNNIQRSLIGILAASLATVSLTGCSLLDKIRSLPESDCQLQRTAGTKRLFHRHPG